MVVAWLRHMGISGRKELYLNSKAGRDQEGPNIPAALEQGWLELARELDVSCNVMQPPASADTTQE